MIIFLPWRGALLTDWSKEISRSIFDFVDKKTTLLLKKKRGVAWSIRQWFNNCRINRRSDLLARENDKEREKETRKKKSIWKARWHKLESILGDGMAVHKMVICGSRVRCPDVVAWSGSRIHDIAFGSLYTRNSTRLQLITVSRGCSPLPVLAMLFVVKIMFFWNCTWLLIHRRWSFDNYITQ